MITIEHLSKQYAAKQVLSDINLVFETGKVYGLVGENGAGKTTLFRCIAGLESHTGIITADTGDYKKHIGYLPTELYFFSRITGREYIRLLCNARKIPVPDIGKRNIFDLPLDRFASNYSTGMQKKLALLALLLQENEYYILDEPFNGLDLESNFILAEIIKQLKSLGKTLIISSHIFLTLYNLCDEIQVLKEGKNHKSVMQNEFHLLEEEMRKGLVSDKIQRLDLK